MRIDGSWLLCDDGIVRPIFRGRMLDAQSQLIPVVFLADVGADRTVICAETLERLGLTASAATEQLGGVGGQTVTVEIQTKIHFFLDTGVEATFAGRFAAFTDPKALDMCVLGRDISNLFALIVDRPQDVVCMIGQGNQYTITKDT